MKLKWELKTPEMFYNVYTAKYGEYSFEIYEHSAHIFSPVVVDIVFFNRVLLIGKMRADSIERAKIVCECIVDGLIAEIKEDEE